MTIRIDIYYKANNAKSPVHLPMTAETYFDQLEPGESYAIDGVPRFNFTWEYLDVAREQLIWSIERRSGTCDDTILSTQYFDGGKTWTTHRSDPDGYEELIHSIDLGTAAYLTLRSFRKPGGRWVAHMVSMRDSGDNELYSLPEGTFESAHKLSTELAGIIDRDGLST